MKTTIVLLAILSVSMAGGIGSLYSVMEPQSNWMNPVSGSWIEFYLMSDIETSTSTNVNLLIGLPFTTTNLNVEVMVVTDSCVWQGDSSSGSVRSAEDSVRETREGLNYYYVSTSATYIPRAIIGVKLSMDLPSTAGWTRPLHVALISAAKADYQVWAENDNIAPLYILEAAKEGMVIVDKTTDTKKSSMSSSILVSTELTPTLSYRRIKMVVSGYAIDSSSTFVLTDISTTLVETVVDVSKYTVNKISDSEVDLLFTNTSEWRASGTVRISWTVKSPDSPSTSSLNIKTMDLYGPNIIEMGSLGLFLSCSTVAWSSGYPKVKFSYGMDASSTSGLKDSYGLYTVGGTSLVYNTLSFELKTGATLPSGTQTVTIVIGSSTVNAYPALNTLTHTFAALTGEEVDCDVSDTLITCTGVDLKGKSGIVSLKVAYTKSGTQITDFAKAVLKVGGVTIVTGTASLKTGFATPIGNRSPVAPSKWGTYISSAFGSRYIEDLTDIDGDNIDEYLPLDSDDNGIYIGDGQLFYFWSRIGPYDYYSTSLDVQSGDDPKKMYVELTVPQDISANYEDNSADNMIAYLDEAGMLNTELDQDFYWDDDTTSTDGWLKWAVERPLCDADLDDVNDDSDRLSRSCVDWFCYVDYDGDGSYDSPQPCKPVRACDSSEDVLLWYPKNNRLDRHAALLSVDTHILLSDDVQYSDLTDLMWAAFGTHSADEICRPVLECDTTDAANGDARHWNKHSSGNDCLRSEQTLCNVETNEGDGILSEYSDGTTDCEEVQACDLDSDGDSTLDSALDGGYCNPIDLNDDTTLIYQQCDELPSKSSSVTHGTAHTTLEDCVQQPICTAKSTSSVDGLDILHVDGDCLEIDDDDDLCTDWILLDSDALQVSGGLTLTDTSSTSCWFVPVCDMAPEDTDDLAWVTDERIDGKYCTVDIPICNWGTPYSGNYNKAVFLYYSNKLGEFYGDTGTVELYDDLVAAEGDSFSDCYSLESCDTFDANDVLREHSEQHACYKLALDNSYDESYADADFEGIQCHKMWDPTNLYVLESIGLSTATTEPHVTDYEGGEGDCVRIHTCNAVNDDGDAVYVDRYGYETDCFEHDTLDLATNRQRGHYGMVALSDDTDLPQATCQWRSEVNGDLDVMPWGWNCVELLEDDLCTNYVPVGYSTYESIGADSDCQLVTDCEYNAWVQNSKYYLHILADMEQDIVNPTYRNMEQWATYWNMGAPKFMSQYCLPTYDDAEVDYISPDDAADADGMNYDHGVFDRNERRRNLGADAEYFDEDHSENYINVPGTYLFIEDVVYTVETVDSVSTNIYVSETNPLGACRYETGGDGYNILKFQAAEITAEYVTAPRAHMPEVSSFTVQTWNLLFFTPYEGTDESGHNIFAFKDTNIAAAAANSLTTTTSTDVHLLDLFWAVYFKADTSDITVSLTSSPSLKGLENLVIYTDMDDGDVDTVAFFGDEGVYWTTYSYYGIDRADASLNNFFVVYGDDLGDDTDLALAGTLTLFFGSIEGIPMDSDDDVEGSQDIDCSSLGIEVSACRYVTANTYGLASSSVTYRGDPDSEDQSATVSNPLYWGRVEIDLVDGSDEDSWSIIFPFDGGVSTTSIHPLIGLQDSSERLLYLSGLANGNWFGPGAGDSDDDDGYYVYAKTSRSSSTSLSGLYRTASDVDEIYNDPDVASGYGAWLEFDDTSLVCSTISSASYMLLQLP